MREKREGRAPRVSLAPKTPLSFPFQTPTTQATNQNTPYESCYMTSLCTDVPPPAEKKSGEETLFSPFFFLREGGRLYTGYYTTGEQSFKNRQKFPVDRLKSSDKSTNLKSNNLLVHPESW